MASKTGYSVFVNGELKDWGIITPDTPTPKFVKFRYDDSHHPYDYLDFTVGYGDSIIEIIKEINPDVVGFEQTNKGRNRWTQKLLEFLHFYVNYKLRELNIPAKYIDTIKWRGRLGIKLDKETKRENRRKKSSGEKGKINIKKFTIMWVNERLNLDLKTKDDDIADSICIGLALLQEL